MDTPSKIIFLREVLARKDELFSKTDSKHKDEMWHEVYDVCVAKGCVGLRDAEYLRRTTYQNLQRRAKEKYEKAVKMGHDQVNLSEVDEIILDIIGRDKCTPPPENVNENNFQRLLRILSKNEKSATGLADLPDTDSYSILDPAQNEKLNRIWNGKDTTGGGFEECPSELDVQPKLPEAISHLFHSLVNQTSHVNSMNSFSGEMALGESFPPKRKRLESSDDSDDNEEDGEGNESLLKRRKLRAEIRLLNAQIAVQEREAELKHLQIQSLKRELKYDSTAD